VRACLSPCACLRVRAPPRQPRTGGRTRQGREVGFWDLPECVPVCVRVRVGARECMRVHGVRASLPRVCLLEGEVCTSLCSCACVRARSPAHAGAAFVCAGGRQQPKVRRLRGLAAPLRGTGKRFQKPGKAFAPCSTLPVPTLHPPFWRDNTRQPNKGQEEEVEVQQIATIGD
jgi:hypothetical protein